MAFISDIDIANMAISHVGASSDIESFNEKSTEAIQCKTWYDQSRLMALAAFDWGFARRRLTAALHGDTISETATDPLAGVWGYRYEYPADCVKMRKIQKSTAPPDDLVPFNIETSLDGQEKTVLTDMEDAVFVYTFDQKGTELFNPMFIQAFSHLLASQIAFAVTNKRKIKIEQFSLYQSVIRSAAAEDANEGIAEPVRDAEVVRDGFGSA